MAFLLAAIFVWRMSRNVAFDTAGKVSKCYYCCERRAEVKK